MTIASILQSVNSFVWGPVMLAFLVGTGIYLTIRLKFRPITNLFYSIRQVTSSHSLCDKNNHCGDISPFQSLMASLGTAVGSGNIVGVATALVLGGAGALFWMWISAFFGFATKYAESLLAVEYRITNAEGQMSGGPMYVLKQAIKTKWLGTTLAALFALFTIFASFGIGNMAQSNSLAQAVLDVTSIPTAYTGIFLTIICAVIIFGGIRSIGKVSAYLVPIMTLLYVAGALIIVITHYQNIIPSFKLILQSAFSLTSAGGGITGYLFAQAMRFGIARGVFSNEAGLGSAAIMAASAKTDHPARQGYINMTAVFFDTIIVCTLTGLAIITSGVLGTLSPSGTPITGAALTIEAFSTTFGPIGGYIITIALFLFIFSTIIGWSYFGEKGLEYLAPYKPAKTLYRLIFITAIYIGSVTSLNVVWDFSDIANALMAVPNLISLLVLTKVIIRLTDDFQTNYIDKGK